MPNSVAQMVEVMSANQAGRAFVAVCCADGPSPSVRFTARSGGTFAIKSGMERGIEGTFLAGQSSGSVGGSKN